MKKNNRICIFGLVFLMALVFCIGCGKEKSTDVKDDGQKVENTQEMQDVSKEEAESQNEDAVESAEEEVKENPKAVFPMEIEEGKLTIDSVFQYSGINLDYNDEICEEIGALQLTNTSEEYLESADITVKLADGNELKFRVEDIPVGTSVIAFEMENTVYDDEIFVGEVTADVSWQQAGPEAQDKIAFSVEGIRIVATNTSSENLQNVTVKYHCSLDGIYFGGKSFEAVLESVAPQESIDIEAIECYLGEAAVANVSY